jgi:hypothetical protein
LVTELDAPLSWSLCSGKQYLILKIPVLGTVWTHYIQIQSYKLITFIFLYVTSHCDKNTKICGVISITSILIFQHGTDNTLLTLNTYGYN